jgi:CBS domain-containing protein
MKISELPPGRLYTVEPSTTLAEVARMMRADDCDAVAVMSDGALVGIVTERDMVEAIADGMNPIEAKAEVVMTANPATVGDDEDVAVVAMKMVRLGIRHLPVVGRDGMPTGILSAGNLVAALDRRS